MADHPLRSATDRHLGEPLLHQLVNQTQAHPWPINLWPMKHVLLRCHEVLIIVSNGYPSVRGRLPTRYSPVRRCPLEKSTEASFPSFSLDLHVLGTPPAFILSQDQTLNKCYLKNLSIRPNPVNGWRLSRLDSLFPNHCCLCLNCTGTYDILYIVCLLYDLEIRSPVFTVSISWPVSTLWSCHGSADCVWAIFVARSLATA